MPSLGDAVVDVRADTTGFDKDLERQVKRSLKRNDDLFSGLGNVGKRLNMISTIGGLVAPVVASIGSAMSAAAAGTTTLVGALGPAAVVSVTTFGGAMAALVPAAATAKVAFMGLGKAIGGDAEAMAKLTPEGRKLAKTFKELGPEWEKVQNVAERSLFPGVTEAVKDLSSTYLPLLKDTFEEVGGVMGDLAAQGGKMLSSGPWTKDFQSFSHESAVNIDSMGQASLSLLDALRSLMAEAAPVTRMFLNWTEGAADTINSMVQAGRESGRLGDWFREAGKDAAQLGDILGDFSVAMFNVFSVGAKNSDSMLDSLERMTQKFRDWTESADGIRWLNDWFDRGNENLSAMGRLLRDIGKGMSGLGNETFFADLTDQVRQDILPPLIDFFDNINSSGAIEVFVRAVGKIVQVFADLAESDSSTMAFARTLEVLADSFLFISDNVPLATEAMGAFLTVMGVKAALGLVGFHGSLLTMDTSLKKFRDNLTTTAQKATAMATAARGAAGIAGLMLLTQGANESNKALSALETAAGGAAAGFAVTGGPWGAAIGGAAGLLISLQGAAKKSEEALLDDAEAVQITRDAFKDLNDVLYENAGRFNEATRAATFDRVMAEGFSKEREVLQGMGLDVKTITNALLGRRDAQALVNFAVIDEQRQLAINNGLLDENRAAMEALPDDASSRDRALALQAEADALKADNDAIKGRIAAGKELITTSASERAEANAKSVVVTGLTLDQNRLKEAYEKTPKQVQTAVEALGVNATISDVRKVLKQYDLTPQQKKTIFEVFGDKLVLRKVRGVKKAVEDVSNAKGDLSKFRRVLESDLGNVHRTATREAEAIADNLKDGTGKARPNLDPFKSSFDRQTSAMAENAHSDGTRVGSQMGQGMYTGMGSWIGPIATQAAAMVNAAEAAARRAADSNSPSKKFRRLGQDLMVGMRMGIEDEHGKVLAAMKTPVVSVVGGRVTGDVRPVPSASSAHAGRAGAGRGGSALPRKVILRVGAKDFVGYIEEIADDRIEAADSLAWQGG